MNTSLRLKKTFDNRLLKKSKLIPLFINIVRLLLLVFGFL